MKLNRCIHLSSMMLALSVAALPGPSLAGGDASPGTEKRFALSGEKLVLANLAGEIHVERGAGPAYEIVASVHGDPAAVARVRFESSEGETAKLFVQYPFPREDHFIYPAMGHGSKVSLGIGTGSDSDGWGKSVLPEHGRGRIEIRSGGSGTEIWADITVRVPPGKQIDVRHGVGKIDARGIQANASLDSHSGPILASAITGDLVIDTGSGNVDVDGIQGDVSIDTGSGNVDADEIKGDVSIDTGSGDVHFSACTGERILIDTGSGSVDAEGIECMALKIDTGSGNVEGLAVKTDEALIDTGSGRIGLGLDRMGKGPYRLDTGSGAIDIRLPADASATLSADTGSGRIRLDVSEARIRHLERTTVALILGDGAARVQLDTGSGPISIRQ